MKNTKLRREIEEIFTKNYPYVVPKRTTNKLFRLFSEWIKALPYKDFDGPINIDNIISKEEILAELKKSIE